MRDEVKAGVELHADVRPGWSHTRYRHAQSIPGAHECGVGETADGHVFGPKTDEDIRARRQFSCGFDRVLADHDRGQSDRNLSAVAGDDCLNAHERSGFGVYGWGG